MNKRSESVGVEFSDEPAEVPVRPAATVILVRDGDPSDPDRPGLETLLLRRDKDLAFAGGSWVFPGGRVDAEDREQAGPEASEEELARVAAVREAHEEAGLSLAPDELVPLSHWTTPPGPTRRFATWFFLAPAPRGAVTIDDLEVVAHRWFEPAAATEAKLAGELQLAPPTFVTLTWLAGHGSVAEALAAAREIEVEWFETRIVVDGDKVVGLFHGDAGYETGRIDAGPPHHRLWFAPDWRYVRDA